MPRGVQVAVLAIALAVSLPGCGRASYHAGLREGDALEVGATLADVIARHGCPDAIQTVSSGTFTLEYRKIELEGFLPGRIFERRQSLAYLVRREKNGDGVRLISPGTFHESGSSVSGLGDATAALEAPALRSRPLASAVAAGAVLCAFLGGTLLGPRKPRGARRTVVAALVLGALTCGVRRSGGGGWTAVASGSHLSEVVNQHGAPDEVVTLPGDAGTLAVYRSHERTDLLLLGSERSSHAAYLVQSSRVVASSLSVTDVTAQYSIFPFYELERAPRPSIAGTVASTLVFAGLAFALGARITRPKMGRTESASASAGTTPPS